VSGVEINFDGLVGPTHNFGGLSFGNKASMEHSQEVANPKAAALQGLEKMKWVADLGLIQGVLPPQQRPDLDLLRRVGFWGSDGRIVEEAYAQAPHLLAAAYSSASMWSANAGTFTPSADACDGRAHFTPANLSTHLHRSREHETTQDLFFALFAHPSLFLHHPPLPAGDILGDEGAANHTRFCREWDEPGVELFVYGAGGRSKPERFPARQHLEASKAIARLHRLDPAMCLFAQQNPDAIDAGCFHSDVCAVGHKSLFFLHERALVDQPLVIEELQRRMGELEVIEIKEEEIPLEEAVATYLFNSQLLSTPSGGTLLLAPIECERSSRVHTALQRIVDSDHSIDEVHFCDLTQSMNNGGGPACLRIRIALNLEELSAVHSSCIFDQLLYEQLTAWIDRHYRDRLTAADLADPQLIEESYRALDELTDILDLGPLYPFQRE